MAQFKFELVSPEKLITSKSVTMVTVPGGEGEYGVLVNHAPMITTVKPGVITIYADNDTTVTERIFVGGGFAEVTPERCTVLVEEALPVNDLDHASLDLHAKMLDDSMSKVTSDVERARIESEMAVTQAKLVAITV